MWPRSILYATGLLAAALASGCSGPGEAPVDAALVPADNATVPYELNDEEKALDCKKLTGRMQVRILQVRDFEARNNPSLLSHALQKAVVTAGSSATSGLDPGADHARDRAQLEAYNQRLAALNCKTFNLDDELQHKAVTATPTPVGKSKQASEAPHSDVTVPVDQVGAKTAAKTH